MLTLILNPIAGGGLSVATHRRLCDFLAAKDVPFETFQTEKAGDAERKARELAQAGAEAVGVLGGDGTVHEVVNGLAGSAVICYFVPCGTGNDFIKAMSIPKEPISAFEAQLSLPPRYIDLGQMNERLFANVAGTGFDVEVLRQAVRFKALGRGLLPYLLGLLAALRRFVPIKADLQVNGAPDADSAYTIVSIGNGQYIGGGMRAVPTAKLDDGLLDAVLVRAVNRRRILTLLPKFIGGKHVDLPIARVVRCETLSIRSKGMTINLDGELLPVDSAEFCIRKAALRVCIP